MVTQPPRLRSGSRRPSARLLPSPSPGDRPPRLRPAPPPPPPALARRAAAAQRPAAASPRAGIRPRAPQPPAPLRGYSPGWLAASCASRLRRAGRRGEARLPAKAPHPRRATPPAPCGGTTSLPAPPSRATSCRGRVGARRARHGGGGARLRSWGYAGPVRPRRGLHALSLPPVRRPAMAEPSPARRPVPLIESGKTRPRVPRPEPRGRR